MFQYSMGAIQLEMPPMLRLPSTVLLRITIVWTFVAIFLLSGSSSTSSHSRNGESALGGLIVSAFSTMPISLLSSTARQASASLLPSSSINREQQNSNIISNNHRSRSRLNEVHAVVINSPYDRFTASCPADVEVIRYYFDSNKIAALPMDNDSDDIVPVWVAVYRSNQNQPSVLVRDEFIQAMNDATRSLEIKSPTQQQQTSSSMSTPTPLLFNKQKSTQRPVAIAQMKKVVTGNNKHSFLIDCIQCTLKKESMEQDCDGGSEYLEALGVAIDELLVQNLHSQQQQQEQSNAQDDDDSSRVVEVEFEKKIRVKATLFSAKVVEDRGFLPVEAFSKDMATHISSYDRCLQQYAARVTSPTLGPASRDRALQIVTILGRLDRDGQEKVGTNSNKNDDGENIIDDDDDEYDPWAGINLRR
jgi:hypothetical protein